MTWIVAGILGAANSYEVWGIVENMQHGVIPAQNMLNFVLVNVREVCGLIWQVASLFAFGALIEVLDQARWEAARGK